MSEAKKPQKRSPRLAIATTPEMRATFEAFAEAQGLSTASAVRQLLNEMLPSIQQLTRAINKAKSEPDEALEGIRDFFIESQAQISQAGLDLNTEIRSRKPPKK